MGPTIGRGAQTATCVCSWNHSGQAAQGFMAEQRYYVIGGEYADTSFTNPAAGADIETHGPFTNEREAKVFWRSIMGKYVDNAMVRYFLKPEEQLNGKIYWVVGGEYADSSFSRIAAGKQ